MPSSFLTGYEGEEGALWETMDGMEAGKLWVLVLWRW